MAAREKMQSEAKREALIKAALPIVMHEGWTARSLKKAAQKAGMPPEYAPLLFPEGAAAAASFFCSMGDRALSLRKTEAQKKESTDKRIAFLIMERLREDAPHKEAARRAYLCLALPAHSAYGLRALLKTSDALWRAAGDDAVDFSYYTKRLILGVLYLEVLLVSFGAKGDDEEYLLGFTMRRLQNVQALGKSLGALRAPSGLMEEILKNLARLRYPERRSESG